MKQRIKQILAVAISIVISMQLIPNNVWTTVFAATLHTIQDGDTVTITDESAAYNIYKVISGGRLVVADGGKVEGEIDASSVGEVEVQAGGTVTNSIVAYEYAEITVAGTVENLDMGGNATLQLNSGLIKTLTASSATSAFSVIGSSTVQNLKIYPTNLNSGTNEAKIYADFTLEFAAAGAMPSHTKIEVTEDTIINNPHGTYADIICSGITYPIVTGATGVTIFDYYNVGISDEALIMEEEVGYTTPAEGVFTIENNGLEPVMVELPFPDDFIVEYDTTQSSIPDYYSIPAGGKITATVTPKAGLAVGEYAETIEMHMLSGRESVASGANLELGSISCELNLSVNRKPGVGSIQVSDSYYGGTYAVIPSSATNGVANVKLEYKEQGADDSTFTTTQPTQVGKYEVRAFFAQTDEYNEVVTTKQFQIDYLPAPEGAYTFSGKKGTGGYFTENVTITPAEGYLIASQLDGNYTESLALTENMTSIYLMKADTEEKTAEIPLDTASVKVDIQEPAIIGAVNGSTIYKDKAQITVTDENLSALTVNGEAVQFRNGKAVLTLDAEYGSVEYVIVAKDKAGHEKKITVTVATPWLETGIIPSGSTVKLNAEQAYTFGSGTWQVSGDTTNYAGGVQFYVQTEGSYVFKKQ
ncbi:MAG: hypothetical protein IJ040_02060 [Lachnospiraceae bacterium]|nr:hypothetical protein [Lachnospiraceae bacterium]